MPAHIQERMDAGRHGAAKLTAYADWAGVLVPPRGGPADVFLARTLGVPDHKELVMGAIATGGLRVLT